MDQARTTLRASRLVAVSLPTGVVLLWLVGWVITRGGTTGLAPRALAADAALWIWSAAALAGFAGALAFRARALQAAQQAALAPSRATLGPVQTNLIVAWAVLEVPALLAGVFLLLLAARVILWAAAGVYALGLVLTFPRAEWFGVGDDADH